MNLRILLARRISKRLECEARVHYRALRDHLRQETSRIHRLEIRSRGLRLYAAWSASASNVIQAMPSTAIKPRSRRVSQKPAPKHPPLLIQPFSVLQPCSIEFTPMPSFAQIREGLRKQHPEGIDNGKSPLCDSYKSAPQLESGR
jgi:hypothetical protein